MKRKKIKATKLRKKIQRKYRYYAKKINKLISSSNFKYSISTRDRSTKFLKGQLKTILTRIKNYRKYGTLDSSKTMFDNLFKAISNFNRGFNSSVMQDLTTIINKLSTPALNRFYFYVKDRGLVDEIFDFLNYYLAIYDTNGVLLGDLEAEKTLKLMIEYTKDNSSFAKSIKNARVVDILKKYA